jgi:catechol 2,3-dioxygenase-like lactoylglutathione lyase family enzyme
MKTHINLSTRDLARSIAFYKTLLDAEPQKSFEDYALFVTDDPGLELALASDRSATIGESAHYGVAVAAVEDVDAAIARLQGAGLATRIEREETCCYASQTKVWTADPDGRRWEVYAVHEETLERDGADCCAVDCCAASA